MTMENYDTSSRGGASGLLWLYLPVLLVLVAGGGLSIAAYMFADPQLTIGESLGAGFGGLAGIIVGLFGAVIGLAVGLVGAAIGIITAGGALAVTLFVVGSPIIAIVLFVLLFRRRSTDCPDPGMH